MEIVNVIEFVSDKWMLLAVFMLILGIMGVVFGITSINDEDFYSYLVIAAGLVLLTISGYGKYRYNYVVPQISYDVIIHDISEFDFDRYEIISVEGRIFRIKDKTGDESDGNEEL